MSPALRWIGLALALAFASGCAASGGPDPFEYARKPLYTGGFDLADLAARGSESQEFRVEDGSIGAVRVHAWVNATAGGARVQVWDPSGDLVLSTTGHGEKVSMVELGVWRVTVTATGPAAGHVGILAVRG